MKEKDKEYATLKAILLLLAGGALLTVSMSAPGILVGLKTLGPPWNKYRRRKLRESLKRLHQKKLIAFAKEGEKMVVKLTERGRVKTLKYKLDDLEIKTPKIWDRRWWVVIFDIPEKKKLAREALRTILKRLGFYKWQRSVFVYPYPCYDEIEFVRSVLEVRSCVRILVVEELEDDFFLRKKFGL